MPRAAESRAVLPPHKRVHMQFSASGSATNLSLRETPPPLCVGTAAAPVIGTADAVSSREGLSPACESELCF